MCRYVRFPLSAVLCLLLTSLVASCRISGGPISNAPTADLDAEKPTLLEGRWQVFSVNYQVTGNTFYSFHGNEVTIESEYSEEKRSDAPRTKTSTNYTFKIDDSQSPNKLIMKQIGAPEIPDNLRTEAIEFKNGALWLTRDLGNPMSSTSVRLRGRETGLRRVK